MKQSEMASLGGKARAKKLSKKRRSIKANQAKKLRASLTSNRVKK